LANELAIEALELEQVVKRQDRDLDWPELVELATAEVERKERGRPH
jgi:hypothetical protein